MLVMENNQSKIIDLLREVHLIAFKEMERLNLRIAELESQNRQHSLVMVRRYIRDGSLFRENLTIIQPIT
jgi:hypothetical protein